MASASALMTLLIPSPISLVPLQSVEKPRVAPKLSEAPGWQVAGGANHGKKSRKFNSDCTICLSCLQVMSGST